MSKANKRLREGDRVMVVAGNDKGRTGTILSRKDDKFIIQGVNIRKKHTRKTQDGPGRILSIEMAIHASNVMLSPSEDSVVKLHVSKNDDGQRELVYLKDDKDTVYRQANKKK